MKVLILLAVCISAILAVGFIGITIIIVFSPFFLDGYMVDGMEAFLMAFGGFILCVISLAIGIGFFKLTQYLWSKKCDTK